MTGSVDDELLHKEEEPAESCRAEVGKFPALQAPNRRRRNAHGCSRPKESVETVRLSMFVAILLSR